MKYLLFITLFLSLNAMADQSVHGYYRNNGTYVQPYHRSTPDSSSYNNYSTQGNINPFNGHQGTVSPYYNPPNYNQNIQHINPPNYQNYYQR